MTETSAYGAPPPTDAPGRGKRKYRVIEVPQPATRARLRLRHVFMVLGFLLFTVVPTFGAGVYLYTRAADQYASKVGFTVRKEEAGSVLDVLGGLTNVSNTSSSDTDILYEFIQSQELVRDIDQQLNLRAIYTKPGNDPVFALNPDASIEDLVDYWGRMVRIFYDPGTGLIEVEARAFDPRDAQLISTTLFEKSSAMINELSSIARADITRYAREELDQAVGRLKDARAALTSFRNEKQIVDPTADIQGQMGLLNSLQAQLAEALIDLDLLVGTTRENDPRVTLAQHRIEVIETRISEERRKLGVTGTLPGATTTAFADLVGQFESLRVDLEFAEQAYVAALSAHDGAVSEARRQSRYLAAYLEPTLAETPRYPQRELLLGLIGFFLLASWTILVLVYYSLRDRR